MKREQSTRRIGLARALSKLGYCSRSKAAELIRAGRVKLNGCLQRDPETPPAVIINEALELGRTFSTEESVKFINGMLDAIRKKIDVQR